MVTITDNEATALVDFIDANIFENIRNDVDIDSIMWLYNILNVYKKCGGLKQFSDYEE